MDRKFPGFDEIETLKYCDVDKKIIKFLIEQIEAADKEGIIDKKKFRAYCHEFGMIDPPNILTVPDVILDRCIDEAFEKTRYKDNLNKPYELFDNVDQLRTGQE